MKLIGKSIDILDLFLTSGGELSLEEMTKLSGISKSRVRRIIISLMEHGFIRQRKKRSKYRLGLKLLDYTRAVKQHNPIVEIANGYVAEINQITNETVSLGIWDGRMCAICLSMHPNSPLKITSHEGVLPGLHHNSLGKAILAELPEKELEYHLPEILPRHTENTITDINDLKRCLLTIRREGVAIDDEESFPGIRSIGAVIKSYEGQVAGGITLLGPTIRLTHDKIREYIPAVKETALKISLALGYCRK